MVTNWHFQITMVFVDVDIVLQSSVKYVGLTYIKLTKEKETKDTKKKSDKRILLQSGNYVTTNHVIVSDRMSSNY